MVHLIKAAYSTSKRFLAEITFLDWLSLRVQGGAGGQGLPRHSGAGGDGGDVVLAVADASASAQQNLAGIAKIIPEQKLTAEAGGNSRTSCLMGKRGRDLVLNVPAGVTVRLENGLEIADLVRPGDKILVAHGGRGGGPNNAYNGNSGEARRLSLILKVLTDIALIGFLDAGKSGIMAAITDGSPDMGSAPSSATGPRLGTAKYPDGRMIKVADLPALTRPTVRPPGPGNCRLLRHAERAAVLLLVVDLQQAVGSGGSAATMAPVKTALLLMKELELYKPELLNKRMLLVLNKLPDLMTSNPTPDNIIEQLWNVQDCMRAFPSAIRPTIPVRFDDILCVSAKQGADVELLKSKLRALVDLAADDSNPKSAEKLRARLEQEIPTSGSPRRYLV